MRISIYKIQGIFEKKEKYKIVFILVLMLIAALFETIGIGMIVPFVGIITNPSIIQSNATLFYYYELFGFESQLEFIILSVAILLTVFIFKNLYLLLYNYIQFRIVLNQQVKLESQLFKEYLTKPYKFHIENNSADLLRNVSVEVYRVFQGIILSGLNLLTEILVITFIFILLLFISPLATITVSLILGLSIILFFRTFKNKINHVGREQQRASGSTLKWLNQGFGASKEIKVSGKEKFFIESYTKESLIKVNTSRYIKMLEVAPRLFIETLLVSVILITMLIIINQDSNTSHVVSSMALFAMAAFRIMPSFNRIVALITTIKYNYAALDVVYEDLIVNKNNQINSHSAVETNNKMQKVFTESIQLDHVYHRYPNQNDFSVKDVSLTIPIGKSVAFIGESGSGKTTIIDIILGVLEPEKGNVIVDGLSLKNQISQWRNRIGYIPQSIYLSDDTIRGNIAFGVDVDKIEEKEVWRALDQAKLKDFVLSLPEGLDTFVGERGVRLSGGQRQRLGIARALYNNPEVLFMDEATSALDTETEKEIIRSIDCLKGEKTLIIIAHRLSTIEKCDIIFRVHKGKIERIENKLEPSII